MWLQSPDLEAAVYEDLCLKNKISRKNDQISIQNLHMIKKLYCLERIEGKVAQKSRKKIYLLIIKVQLGSLTLSNLVKKPPAVFSLMPCFQK